MENREEFFGELLKRVQKNYMHMVEIERLTKELGDVLSTNDRESAQLLLDMRGEELDKARKMKYEIQTILQAVNEEEKEDIRALLNGKSRKEPEDFESRKILELSGQMVQIVKRTVAVDKVINMKLGGEKSYYQSVQ